MSFKKDYIHMKSDEGSGLVLALMTLMVLSVLGLSLGAVTVGSFKLGDVNRDDTSAYYIAEAGANLAYEEMKAGVMAAYESKNTEGLFFDDIEKAESGILHTIEKSTYDFEPQFGDKPTVSISFTEPEGVNPKTYTIISTAEVAGKKRTVEKPVEVTWVERNTSGGLPVLPDNTGLIAKKTIKFLNGSIEGDIYLDSSKQKSLTLSNSGTVTSNLSTIYSNINNPEDLYTTSGNFSQDYLNSFVSRTKAIPEKFSFNRYENYLESFESSLETPFISKPNLNLDSYSGINDYTYIHDEWNKHKLVEYNNIYLDTWMTDEFSLNLSNDTAVNDILMGQRSKLEITTDSNLSIQNMSINNSSRLIINTTGNNQSLHFNNVTTNNIEFIINTKNDIDIYLNNINLNSSEFIIQGSGNANIFIEDNLTLNTGNLNFNGSGNYKVTVNNYHHNNGLVKTNGRLNLNVINNFSFSSGNINKDGDVNNLNFNYFGSKKITLAGSVSLLGSLYIKEADLDLTGSGNVHGAIISGGKHISVDGGSLNDIMMMAPKSKTKVDAGGSINGVVIADELEINGGASIKYKEIILGDHETGSPDVPENIVIDTLIRSNPAIEQN